MQLDDSQLFLSNRLLHLILMPTEQCNFRCVYCYEDFVGGEMGRAVVDAVKALMRRRVAHLDLLSVEWFGGEPLLAWPIVEEIQSYAQHLTRRHDGVRLAGAMTTNGSLLGEARFRRLLRLGVTRYQISLDGDREAHDRQRRRRGGGGSFKAIWHNLLGMRAVPGDFQVLLRLHATRANLGPLERLLHDLSRDFAGDPRFPVMFKAVRRFGGPCDASIPVLARDREEEVLDRLCQQASHLGIAVQRSPFLEEGILKGCYAAAVNSYVVRSNGDLAKCTVALRHDQNRVGTLRRDGTVELDSRKMMSWIRGALTGHSESIMCPMKEWAEVSPVAPAPIRHGGDSPATLLPRRPGSGSAQ